MSQGVPAVLQYEYGRPDGLRQTTLDGGHGSTGPPFLNPQPNPQNAMSYATSACFGSLRGL